MSDSPLSPVGLNIVGLNVNEHTAAQAAAFLNETSTTSSSDETPSLDANYNSHDSTNAAATLQYPTAPQVPVKQPTISESSSESEPEGDLMTDDVDTANHVASGSSTVNTNSLPTGRSLSPPPNCAICLGRCKNKCYTDSCMHQFCFKCLCEWSKVKPECPLCKQTFSSIIHNVKSDNQFEEYHVQPPTVQIPQRPFERLPVPYIVDVVNGHNIRNPEWNPWRINSNGVLESYRRMYTARVPAGDEASGGSAMAPASSNLATHAEFVRMFPEGISLGNHTQMWRRYVYERKLYALPVCDITGRFRESSARFYRENPAQMYRLMPWINREVVCLLRNTEHDSNAVLNIINDSLVVTNILSPSFRRRLQPFLGAKTAHFIHELNNFARSPFDMIGYDRNVQYSRQMSEEIVLDFSSSGSSDDDNTLRTRPDRHQSSGPEYRLQSGSISTSEPHANPQQQPVVNLLAFTISTTSEGNEAPGVTSASGSRESQSIAMNLTTHNRTNSEVINLVDVDASTEGDTQSGGNDRATAASANASATSTSLTDSTANQPMENIELNSSSSSDDCQFVLERKPPHLRTPEMVSLNSDSDSDVVFVDELKAQSKNGQAPLLEQNSFNTTDDDNEVSQKEAIAHYTRRSTAIKYESNLDKLGTGASTSRGLRATGRRHSDAAEPDIPKTSPSPNKRRAQRLRHRGLRSHSKSMRQRADANSDCDDSSSSSDMDSSPNKVEDSFRGTKRKARSSGKRMKDSTRVSGPPPKRSRHKSKKRTSKANSTDSSASELYNASESCSDNEENEVLEDVRKRLRKQKTQEKSNPMEYGTRNVYPSGYINNDNRPDAGQDDTDITNSSHSLNLTNPVRKTQYSLRTTSQHDNIGEEQAASLDAAHSQAETSSGIDATQVSNMGTGKHFDKAKRTSSNTNDLTSCELSLGQGPSSSSDNNEPTFNTSGPSLSSSPAFADVGASLYIPDSNPFTDYERFLESEFGQPQTKKHRDDSHSNVDASNEGEKAYNSCTRTADRQFSIDFHDDTPCTSQSAARATTTSLNKFTPQIEDSDMSVFRDAANSITETGENLLKDEHSTWGIAETNRDYVASKISPSVCGDRLTEERDCTVATALRETMESLREVANESLKSEMDDGDENSDNNTDSDDSNNSEEEVQGNDSENSKSDDDVEVDNYESNESSTSCDDFM